MLFNKLGRSSSPCVAQQFIARERSVTGVPPVLTWPPSNKLLSYTRGSLPHSFVKDHHIRSAPLLDVPRETLSIKYVEELTIYESTGKDLSSDP